MGLDNLNSRDGGIKTPEVYYAPLQGEHLNSRDGGIKTRNGKI